MMINYQTEYFVPRRAKDTLRWKHYGRTEKVESTDGRTDERTDGRTDGRTDERMDGRTDGATDKVTSRVAT